MGFRSAVAGVAKNIVLGAPSALKNHHLQNHQRGGNGRDDDEMEPFERTSGCSFCDVIFLVNNNNQTTTFSAVLDTFTDAAADDDTVGKEMDGVVVVLVAAREWFLF